MSEQQTVVVVEDEHLTRERLLKILTTSGISVTFLKTMDEVDTYLQGQDNPTAWVVDGLFPIHADDRTGDFDAGIKAIEKIRAMDSLAIIFSNSGSQDIKGADDHLRKTEKMYDLPELIRAKLAEKRLKS